MSMEKINSGKNLIDATQNAVIEAAENVSNMIEGLNTTNEVQHEIFYLSAEFWVATAFVLTIILLSRPIYKALKSMIRQRIEYIRKRLESAEQLQNDAENLLASYERKFRNVNQEVEAILKKSQKEIDYYNKYGVFPGATHTKSSGGGIFGLKGNTSETIPIGLKNTAKKNRVQELNSAKKQHGTLSKEFWNL